MAGLSLRQRALAALTRREHSRTELARKLRPHAGTEDELETLLDDLARERLLSEERFAESLVHRRSERYGGQRIARELKEHGLAPDLIAAEMERLQESELARCRSVWQKRFGELPGSLAERARQQRFLLARGFSGETVSAVLRGRFEDD